MENSQKVYNEIVLAAWLHDVGKFAQRAGMEQYCSMELEGYLGKLQKGDWYSHKHVLYTEGFLQAVKDCLPDEVRTAEVINLSAAHHNPSTYGEWLIAQGDRLSSGSDRCKILQTNHWKEWEDAKFYEKPLVHLISTLSIDKRDAKIAYTPLAVMEKEAILAKDEKNIKIDKEQYKKLWQDFEKGFRALKGLKYTQFMQALDTLLERYTWCIPSSTIDDRDVSLYQHAKTTATFAGTLFRYHEAMQTETIDALESATDEKFLFINGDMSGIQKYIFDLKDASQNAKLLRARSFQLWALSEILAEYLAVRLKGSRENIITSAGGKFLLVVANTPENKGLIPKLRLELETWFINEFAGKLLFILSDGISAGNADVQKTKMQTLLNKIGTDAERAKQRKMQAYLDNNGQVLESYYQDLQENGECAYCGVLPGVRPVDDDSDKKICRHCADLAEIGRKLLHANKIVLKTEKLLSSENIASIPFTDMIAVRTKEESSFGYTINDYKAGYPLMFLPYVAPWEDEQRGILKTFEDIAKLSTGNQKLAMFKADIDNLGLVFSSSLGEDRVSFSRYAQLSRQLHYFFSGYYADFVTQNAKYRDKIYTVFSGGDDLCVLGAWDAVLHFAAAFRKELAKFTNYNPSITLSGGIALANPGLPVRNIAEEAEAALEMAKKHSRKDGNIVKNAICAFSVTVSWDEYDRCLENAQKIVEYMKGGQLTTGVVYKMIDFANRAANVKNKGSLRDMIWMSNFKYVVARNIKDEKVKEWFSGLGTTENIEKSRIAVSYALYANRKNKED
jgi:CRISPR-associated protein Csm1